MRTKRTLGVLFGVFAFIAVLPNGFTEAAAAAPASCRPIMLYGVRGSGEPPGLGAPIVALQSWLKAIYGASSVGAIASPYPAVPVDGLNLVKNIPSGAYANSVKTGVTDMQSDLTFLNRCTASKIVVAGYSQGADVVRHGILAAPQSLLTSLHARVAGVVLFGDPYFWTSDFIQPKGSFSSAKVGIAKYLLVHGGQSFPTMSPTFGRPISFCHALDPVCQFPNALNFAAHSTYGNDAVTAVGLLTRLATKPSFTTASPPTGATVGTGYSYRFAASGSPAPTFGLSSGAFPPGVGLSPAGLLTGAPTASGSYTFSIRASNAGGSATTPLLTIVVGSGGNRPPIGTAYVVDDLSSGFTWSGIHRFDGAFGYGGHTYWTYATPDASDACLAQGHDSGTWATALPVSGAYELQVFIPSNDATTRNAQYLVSTSTGTQVVPVNQEIYFDAWVSLGTFNMGSGQLSLNDITGECGTAFKVGFDAVQWIYRG